MPSEISASGGPPNTSQRDLFLSYNSSDRDAVVRVRQVLGLRNISTFYDRADLTPGQPWFDELESALRQVRGVAVFIGKDGLGTVQKREMQFALARQATEEAEGKSFPVAPVLLPGSNPEMVSAFLALNTWVDLRRDMEDARAVDPFVRAIQRDPAEEPEKQATAICPYRGLNAFREEDAPLYFGREAFSRKLLAHVLKQNLVVVIGRSGSGKSSVVQAGLLPLLRLQRPPDDTWEAVIFTPGSRPFHRMASQLVALWSPPDRDQTDIGTESEKLGSRLSTGEVTLSSFIDLALRHLPDTDRLLVIVDQFEELFTQTAQEDQRHRFVGQLLDATREANLKVVLTLRADFYGKAIGLRNLSDAMEASIVNVGEMARDELKRAVEGPARRTGLCFETGLVERILDHVEQQPGSLPLLEYALTELWRRRQGGELKHAAYEAIGGVEGAISKRAEEQFEKLSGPERDIALPALSRLVHVSSVGEESADTRQVVSLSEFDADAQAVIGILAAREARLVVIGRDETSGKETVEVAHEALIRGWADLRRWIDKDREFLLWRQQLRPFLEKWRGLSDGKESALLHGVYLTEAQRWLRERGKDLNSEERQFVQASEGPEVRSRLQRRLAAAVTFTIVLAPSIWLWWSRSDLYQIRSTLSMASELIVHADEPEAWAWLSALALSGRTAEAVAEVRLMANPDSRGPALASLALTLAKSGQTSESTQLAHEALRTLPLMDSTDDRDSAISDVAQALVADGQVEEALAAFRKIAGPGTGAFAVAKAFTETGKLDKLMESARHREGPWANDADLAYASKTLASAGHADEALMLARMTKNPGWRVDALVWVAAELRQAGRTELVSAVAEEAFQTSQELKEEPGRSHALNWVVQALADSGKWAEALTLTGEIQDQTSHDQALLDIAERLARSGRTGDALALAKQTRDPQSVGLLLGTVVTTLARAGKGQEAADTALHLKHAGLAAEGLFGQPVDLVEALAEQKPIDALSLARQINEPGQRVHALATVAEALRRAGKNDDARKLALEALAGNLDNRQTMDDSVLASRAQDYATLMAVLANTGMSREAEKAGNEALAAAGTIRDDTKRSDAFLAVATGFARSHSYRQARLAADRCTGSKDKLDASAAILREYTIQHHPDSAKVFTEVFQ